MSIASEITRISTNVSDAYAAANAKGATMPTSQNSDNLATTIASIPTGGVTPTGTLEITTNGTYNVTDYASAEVSVPSSAPELYRALRVDENGKIVNSISTNFNPLPSDAVDIGDYVYYNAYQGTPANIISGEISLSPITTISGTSACYQMFDNCLGITSVDLSSLTTITGTGACDYMFSKCFNLTSVDLSNLTSITGENSCHYMFSGCNKLTSVDLSNLTSVTYVSGTQGIFFGCVMLSDLKLNEALTKRNPYPLFANCPLLKCPYEETEYITNTYTGLADGLCAGMAFSSANMKNLELINVQYNNMFSRNTELTDIKFPVLTRWNTANGAQGFLAYCRNTNFTDVYFPMLCVFRNAVPFTSTSFPSQLTVHFRKDQETLIRSTTGASSNFGALAMVFDQIGTITVNGENYIRQGRCNEEGLYAWQKSTASITVDGVDYTFDITQITRNTKPINKGPMLYGWANGSTVLFTDTLKPQVGDFIYPNFNVEKSTTQSISAVNNNDYVYTTDTKEPEVDDNVYSDTQGTVLGTITAVA